MKYLNNSPQTNKKLAVLFLQALTTEWRGGSHVWLSCFMLRAVKKEIAPTFCWQTISANYDYILEIYEI